MTTIKTFLPLTLLLIFATFVYASGLYQALDFEVVRYHHVELTEYINNKPVFAPFLFIGCFTVAVMLFIPGQSYLPILSGFLFTQPFCTLYAVLAATLGSTFLYLILRKPFMCLLPSSFFPKMQSHLQQHALHYLLFLRLLPFIPFWVSNILTPLLPVKPRSFLFITALGICLQAFLLTQAGSGLNLLFEAPYPLSLSLAFSPHIEIFLTSVSILCLFPIFLKKA